MTKQKGVRGGSDAGEPESAGKSKGQILRNFITENWSSGIGDLAKTAGTTPNNVHLLLSSDLSSKSPALRRICKLLGIDHDAIKLHGKIVRIKAHEEDSELVKLARTITDPKQLRLALEYLKLLKS